MRTCEGVFAFSDGVGLNQMATVSPDPYSPHTYKYRSRHHPCLNNTSNTNYTFRHWLWPLDVKKFKNVNDELILSPMLNGQKTTPYLGIY